MKKQGPIAIFTNGIIRENPVLALCLGTCPTLAVTTSAKNGLGMGLMAMMVLVLSNTLISSMKNAIPNQIRIPAYIVIISGLVTVIQLLVKAWAPEIDASLGIFLPLITVNCIILGRAEAYASRNSVLHSALDGAGMGLGFTLALVTIGSIREVIGLGSIFGFSLLPENFETMRIFVLAPGGFFVFGCVIALVNKVSAMRGQKRRMQVGCGACPSAGICPTAQKEGN